MDKKQQLLQRFKQTWWLGSEKRLLADAGQDRHADKPHTRTNEN
jgi:hypothetical protein